MPPPAAQFEQHGEADTADDDAHADRQQDPGVGREAHEVVAVEREAGVVERGDRVKDPEPQRLRPVVVVADPEPERQQGREDGLEGEHGDRDSADHVTDVADVQCVGLGLGDQGGAEIEPGADEHHQQRRQRHDAEAADLDQAQDDDLAER